MAGRLVTINTYRNVIDAQLARSALEAAGITAIVAGENVAANFQYHHLGSIALRVDESDAEAAEQIVNAMYGVDQAELVRPTVAELPPPVSSCPECGSPDIARRPKLVAFGLFAVLVLAVGAAVDQTLAAFLLMLAGGVVFLAAERWRCNQCGARW